MRVAVVTDSTSDLPADLAAAHHISVIPTILVLNGQSYEDGTGISRESFYRQLPSLKTPPTTAAPASGSFSQLYQQLKISGYDSVVSIHLSSALSAVHDSAKAAAQPYRDFVHVVDSQQVSMGIGFQALAAAEVAAQGAGVEAVIAAAGETRRRTRVTAMLDTLEYVRRSGRLSWVKAGFGQVLQLKPYLSLRDGVLFRQGEARSRQKGIQRLYQYLADQGPLERLAILHSTPETDALEMAKEFALHTLHPPLIVQVTPIIGTHVGPNGLGFIAVVR